MTILQAFHAQLSPTLEPAAHGAGRGAQPSRDLLGGDPLVAPEHELGALLERGSDVVAANDGEQGLALVRSQFSAVAKGVSHGADLRDHGQRSRGISFCNEGY